MDEETPEPSMAPSDIVSDLEPEEADEAKENVNSVFKLENFIKELQGQIVTASDRGDPETLSQLMIRLSRVNSALGRQAAYAKYIARNAEHAYKASRDQKKLDAMENGKSGTYADTQRYIKSSKEHNIWSEAQLVADQADDLCFRTDTFIKMSQSRLSLIKNDAARG